MDTISLKELKAKIDNKEDFKLVFTLGDWHFKAMHIPGSIAVNTPERGAELLKIDDEIIVYCSNPSCVASRYAYIALKNAGFRKVRRFADGLDAWQAAGYPLEGEMVD